MKLGLYYIKNNYQNDGVIIKEKKKHENRVLNCKFFFYCIYIVINGNKVLFDKNKKDWSFF